jgi:putative ABC transport system substrate-binding protein
MKIVKLRHRRQFLHLVTRRDFIAGLGTAVVVWPLSAQAQQQAMPVIGFLSAGSPDQQADAFTAFRQGLRETGYVEGRDVIIEYRFAAGQLELLPNLAADLVRRKVSVIVAVASRPVAAAKDATSTIPIVFYSGVDPVRFGLVKALNRPDANLTGFTSLAGDVVAKQLQLVREVAPDAPMLAALIDGNDPNGDNVTIDLQAAARTLGVSLNVLYAGNDRELEEAFTKLTEWRPGGLVVSANAFVNRRYKQIADFTIHHGIPAIGPRQFGKAGGLMDYGATDNFMRVIGVYAGRILKGDKPANLSVQQATKFALTLNMKTARTLGLDVPTSILVRADEVIE